METSIDNHTKNQVMPGLYRHYKNKLYRVIGTARHSEDPVKKLVVYQALYDHEDFGKYQLWIRSESVFLEQVTVEGKQVPRFTYLGSSEGHHTSGDQITTSNEKTVVVTEYPLHNTLGYMRAEVTGRYPESGKVSNKVCDILYIITNGEGNVTISNKSFEIKEGDVIFIPKGSQFSVEGKKLAIGIVSTPAWYPEQFQRSQ